MIPRLVKIAALALPLLLAGCLGVSDEQRRFILSNEDWGLDVKLDENGRVERVFLEGKSDGVDIPEASWALRTGRTAEGNRPYMRIEVIESKAEPSIRE